MRHSPQTRCVAFENSRCIATGALIDVAISVKRAANDNLAGTVLLFDAETSQPIELDLRGSESEVLAKLSVLDEPGEEGALKRGRGRPRLGVVSREITLLPRHWAWLGQQPGGASVTLRKLVEHARRHNSPKAEIRKAQNAAYGFISAVAGNEPGFEEATRSLFRGDREGFENHTSAWPRDVARHARSLAAPALSHSKLDKE